MDLVALLNLGRNDVESIFDMPETTTQKKFRRQEFEPLENETSSRAAVEAGKTEPH